MQPRPPSLPACCYLCSCVCAQHRWTPLFSAAYFGHGPCVELLLGKGAEVDYAIKVCEGLTSVGTGGGGVGIR